MSIQKYDTGISRFVGNYSDAAVVSPHARWLYTSGTPGLDVNGVLPDGIEGQAELAWRNVFAALKAANMKPTDLVKTVSYVVRAEDVPAYVAVRAKWLGDIRPAQMLLLTPGFVNPQFLIEIEAIAAAE